MSKYTKNKETADKLILEYCKNPSTEIRNEIYNCYVYMVSAITRKYTGRGIDYEDLFQVASIALLKAIERFDPSRGFKLPSFAAPTIIGEIKNYFRAYSNNIKVPRRSLEAITKIKVIISKLEGNLGRSPTIKEIAESSNLSEENVLMLLDTDSNSRATSLDVVISPDGEGTLSDVVGSVDSGFKEFELHDTIKRALSYLNEQDKNIIYQRYFKNKTQKDVAQKLGVSQMYVSRAEARILKQLRPRL